MEGKGKETVTQGESSFSHALEEGEIDELYVPEYVCCPVALTIVEGGC